MRAWPKLKAPLAALGLLVCAALLLTVAFEAAAQQAPRKRAAPVAKEAPHGRAEDVKREQQPGAKEACRQTCRPATWP